MSLAIPKTATLVLSVSARLTDDQRAMIVAQARMELPPNVGVLVLDGQFAARVIESAS
ncbi:MULTISPECIES: hypothetical protein [unclassified Massilia]|uniref:hypothetical protein n=1 Tax=unclassified Massilia TaxID=2609279 RepID=UPI0017830D2C|nr:MULTISPECIES: hypothetical protein [unclassified Massilia]MBD8531555.1 hypothetical protein [Massilia sp. CFBP 13647]MBD8673649.1 hypothetical protein [Massilia sp. CFBP 13721]